MRWLISLAGLLVLLPVSGRTQQPLPPYDLPPEIRIPIEQMKFDRATRIEGRVLYLDTYDEALWIEWTAVHDGDRWHTVPSGRQFVVYPASSDMMAFFKALAKGTVLRMTVQRGPDGKRRALVLEGT
ncbi:MAG: hypothetical protein P0111_01555 [Nitrospira sp.]|nr:hypothetical protein [Nitrospira sp.]